METIVLVGGGLAGAKAAETLRAEGFDGRVVLVAGEPELPYERPPLSKGYLLGSAERESARVHEPGWYEANDVELRTGVAAVGLDVAARRVELATGEEMAYDRLLLATGASARRLPVRGADLDGVRYLRTLADADRLRADLADGGRQLVVVGGGWIGLEVAAAARSRGNAVTVVEPQPTPLHAVLGQRMGEVFARLHRQHGVDLLTGTTVREIRGAGGRVTAVVTDRDVGLPADLVVVGIGAVPHTQLAASAGLEVDNGVVTDHALRASAPGVFAAGDVAASFSLLYGRHLRVEHWANALHGGPAAARSMLGQDVTYDRVPYFFTDQYDLGMEYSGLSGPGDTVVCRGDPEDGGFIAFWTSDGHVTAAMNVDVWDVTAPLQALVRSRQRVPAAALADPDAPLESLVV
ncbi:FAD-dependent oxidoreductase [Geodermatophilus aquaeductus]|uniref:3-phenylpropionate/trans-cinnamate dioxygenase ferredoxin reductase subunit n=1 Tax=Geodermatophilus aquaeductus TaxID=1564161 RepID=A0A521DNW0_9ACTN|nr:FAD-dependent oxidoreductase [Geodermatophilus aquaeductus]SMO73282.1 3-phenylpropionate/trans-cinnamate dioxygenase ferredoxin reductase subunit [Geodermatophilus aquaeductus]